MATRTSAKSGNWSATDTWVGGVVPANGDAFVIAAAHDVIFDVDQSAMATGMAASTINGILRFKTTADTFLKMNGNITFTSVGGSPANLFVGNSWADPIPRGVTATIQFSAGATNMVGNSNAAFFFGWVPEHSHSTVATAALTGATSITFTDDMELVAGEKIVIGATGAPMVGDWNDHRMTTGVKGLHTIQTYDAVTKTATLTEPLEHDRAAGDLVGRFTRQIVITRPTQYAYQVSSLLNAHFEGVLFQNTRGPSSHQGYGFMSKWQTEFPGIEAGVFHCTAYNSPQGALGYNPSRILIEDSVVYQDDAPANTTTGIIQYRDTTPSVQGHINRVVCINTHGWLVFNATGCEFNDLVTQNTGGIAGVYSLAGCTVRRWENKTPGVSSSGLYLDGNVFVDCTINSAVPIEARSSLLSRMYNIDGVAGANGSISNQGEFAWQDGATPAIVSGRISYTGHIWHDYPMYFPAGVPMSFAIPCRVRDDQMQARLQIIDPAADPYAPLDLFETYLTTLLDPAWITRDPENPPTVPRTIDGAFAGCLDEDTLPSATAVDEWVTLRVAYTSASSRFLIVRIWANGWVTWDQWWGNFPWNDDEGGNGWYNGVYGTRVEFDVSAIQEVMMMSGVGRTTRLD